MKSKYGKLILAIGITLLVLAGIYGYGSMHYRTHFYSGTTINGVGVSNQTQEQAEALLSAKDHDYTLTIYERGGLTETISANDLNMELIHDGSVGRLLENQKQMGNWISNISGPKAYTIEENYTISANALMEKAMTLTAFDDEAVVQPVDTHIEEVDGKYEIVPATQGTVLKKEETLQALLEACEREETEIDLDALGLYQEIENPVDPAALQERVDQIERIYQASLAYQLRGNTYSIDSELIGTWATVQEDYSVTLDEEAIGAWISQMAYETDTFGLARDFTTHSGQVIRLEGGGDYGWAMDEEQTKQDLINRIRNGEQNDNVQAIYQYGAYDRGVNDIGGTYVEISIVEQKMWLYKDGVEVLETDVVTGNEAAGMATPSGSVWAIDAKKSPAHFKTTNVDVDFWMPFNGGCGIHNATWRSSYGGDIFRTNGSHGCVNTPYDAVKTIYETVSIGSPVVVYYSTDQVVGPSPVGEVTAG